jgi:hypothetical protein
MLSEVMLTAGTKFIMLGVVMVSVPMLSVMVLLFLLLAQRTKDFPLPMI